jgi:ribonuclease HI
MAEEQQCGPFWGAEVVSDLEALSSSLSLPTCDLVLIGDGSGTTHEKSCGWACVAWNKISGDVTMHNGSLSCGTNNFAELIPYVQGLWHFDQFYKSHGTIGTKARVHIISDSEVTVKCGNGEYARKGNACLWGAIEWFEKTNYIIRWTHVYRNTNRFSKRCDWLAGETRIALDRLRAKLVDE